MVVGLVPERGGQVAGDMFDALGAVRTRSICAVSYTHLTLPTKLEV